MSLKVFSKWPTSKRRYTVRWAKYFEPPNQDDSIATSNFVSDPPGIEVVSQSVSGTDATVFLRGGTVGVRYRITDNMTSVLGAEESQSFYVDVMEQK